VAVNVTGWPLVDGLAEEDTAVVVVDDQLIVTDGCCPTDAVVTVTGPPRPP
jgi:hypothetical protein